jgi:hypothetical protein
LKLDCFLQKLGDDWAATNSAALLQHPELRDGSANRVDERETDCAV